MVTKTAPVRLVKPVIFVLCLLQNHGFWHIETNHEIHIALLAIGVLLEQWLVTPLIFCKPRGWLTNPREDV